MYRLVATLAGKITIETLVSQERSSDIYAYRVLYDGSLIGEFDAIAEIAAFLYPPPKAAA